MTSLSRTTSWESAGSHPNSPARSLYTEQPNPTASSSNPPSPPIQTDSTRTVLPPLLGRSSRSPSYSLLSNSSTLSLTNRKSRFADVGTSSGNVERASISMPPPTTKPQSSHNHSNSRRPSTVMAGNDQMAADVSVQGTSQSRFIDSSAPPDDLEKTPNVGGLRGPHDSESCAPLILPDSSLRPSNPSNSNVDSEGNRLSFSSLYSLGSGMYNGATGISSTVPSAASSNAGSVRSGIVDQPSPIPVPLSPSLGSTRSEALSSATTAMDPISVTANSVAQHQGRRASNPISMK